MIRKATTSDLEALINLFIIENKHNSSLAPDIIRQTEDVLSIQELKDIIDSENQTLLIKEINGQPVGALLGNIVQTPARRWTQSRCYAYIEELIVSPKARRQGIANNLVELFTAWANSKGAKSIDLRVWANNSDAIAFYSKTGFEHMQLLLTKKLHD